MGFEPGTPSKPRAISLHRALCRALVPGAFIPMPDWYSILIRTLDVGTDMSCHRYTWLMDRMGLIRWEKKKGVHVLHVEYDDALVLEEHPAPIPVST